MDNSEPFPQTSRRSRNVDIPIAQDKPEIQKSVVQENDSDVVATGDAIEGTTNASNAAIKPDLIFPQGLGSEWHAALSKALQAVGEDARQMLLDELAGQLMLPGKTIHNPVGWMLGLIKSFKQGLAVLALADKVRMVREARAKALQAQAAAQSTPGTQSASAPDQIGQISEQALEAREKLRAMRASWGKDK